MSEELEFLGCRFVYAKTIDHNGKRRRILLDVGQGDCEDGTLFGDFCGVTVRIPGTDYVECYGELDDVSSTEDAEALALRAFNAFEDHIHAALDGKKLTRHPSLGEAK